MKKQNNAFSNRQLDIYLFILISFGVSVGSVHFISVLVDRFLLYQISYVRFNWINWNKKEAESRFNFTMKMQFYRATHIATASSREKAKKFKQKSKLIISRFVVVGWLKRRSPFK